MKIIKYTIENRRVWKELYDTDLKVSLNCIAIYTGTSIKDCKRYMIERGLK